MQYLVTLIKKHNIDKIAASAGYSHVMLYLNEGLAIPLRINRDNKISEELITNDIRAFLIANNKKETDLLAFINDFIFYCMPKFKNNFIKKIVLVDASKEICQVYESQNLEDTYDFKFFFNPSKS